MWPPWPPDLRRCCASVGVVKVPFEIKAGITDAYYASGGIGVDNRQLGRSRPALFYMLAARWYASVILGMGTAVAEPANAKQPNGGRRYSGSLDLFSC